MTEHTPTYINTQTRAYNHISLLACSFFFFLQTPVCSSVLFFILPLTMATHFTIKLIQSPLPFGLVPQLCNFYNKYTSLYIEISISYN